MDQQEIQGTQQVDKWSPGATLSNFRSLVQHPAWAALVEIMNVQVQNRVRDIMSQRPADDKGVYEQEFMKGEAAGITLVLGMPQSLIESAEHDMENKDED